MKIDNAVYRNVAVRWDAVTLPLKAGTPMSAAGVPSNDGGAVGIVTQTVTVRPPVDGLPVLVGGDVSRQEAEALYGEAISDDALAAMSGIRFFGEHGTPDHAPDGGGGSTGGGVFIVTATFDEEAGTLTLDKTWLEIATAMSAGKIVLLLDVGDLSDYGAVYAHFATTAAQGDDYAGITFAGASSEGPTATTYTCSGPNEYPVFAT